MVLIAMCLCPVTFTGQERSKDLLFVYRISSGVDLQIVGVHQTVECPDIESQVGKEPLTFRKENLLDRIHLAPTTARLHPRPAAEARAVCPVPSREAA